jgi:hypothetical protein
MPRIRTIKPEFPQSESMGRVSRDARLTFILLWTLADDSGRLRGNSRMLASLLYPYDGEAPKLIDRWLEELSKEKCLVRYKVNGNQYIEICNWLSHQKIDKPSKSKIEPFANIREDSPNGSEDSSGDQRTKDQGRDQGKDQVSEEAPRRFAKPTLSEVASYCGERGNGIDPESFLAHYESNGWKVGTQPMKSWKHAIVTWEKNRDKFGSAASASKAGQPITEEEARDWNAITGGGE